jgi:antirestriction protein ArdC
MGFVKNDQYQEVTDTIVASLEKALATGSVPAWVKPWKSQGAFRNAFSNRPYSGINTILLAFKPFTDPRYATFNQIRKEGGMVRKGEKGTQIVLWRFLKQVDKTTGQEKTIPLMRLFTVFNVQQADGLKLKALTPVVGDESGRTAEADLALETISSKAKITYGGDVACYSPSTDEIKVPAFESFKSAPAYYATNFHELGHWTAAKTRLDRDLSGRFGGAAYAAEELVAELTATFLCRDLRVDGSVTANATAYLGSWLKALKNDKHMIFKASSLAEKAATFLKAEMGILAPVAEVEKDEEAEG